MEKYQPSSHREKQTKRAVTTGSPGAKPRGVTAPPKAVGNATQPRS